jgi:hypothetical protein
MRRPRPDDVQNRNEKRFRNAFSSGYQQLDIGHICPHPRRVLESMKRPDKLVGTTARVRD